MKNAEGYKFTRGAKRPQHTKPTTAKDLQQKTRGNEPSVYNENGGEGATQQAAVVYRPKQKQAQSNNQPQDKKEEPEKPAEVKKVYRPKTSQNNQYQ